MTAATTQRTVGPLHQAPTTGDQERYRFAYDLLGPVFLEFCHRLEVILSAYSPDDTVALFVSRGGLRLRALFEAHLRRTARSAPVPLVDFYTSRIAAVKAALLENFDATTSLIGFELKYSDRQEMSRALFGADYSDGVDDHEDLAGSLAQIVQNCSPAREYLREQASLLDSYLSSLTGGRKQVVIVDTGWSGTTQAVLMRRYPRLEWTGLYFCKWNWRQTRSNHVNRMLAVSVDADALPLSNPRSALINYHHLIEGLFEINMPSVEEYRLQDGNVVPDHMATDTDILPQSSGDELFAASYDYIANAPIRTGPAISADADKAFKRLASKLRYPSKRDTRLLCVPPRSCDFGRTMSMPVLVVPGPRGLLKSKLARIRTALWKQGQIRLEFPDYAVPVQFAYNVVQQKPTLLHALRIGRQVLKRYWSAALPGHSGRGGASGAPAESP